MNRLIFLVTLILAGESLAETADAGSPSPGTPEAITMPAVTVALPPPPAPTVTTVSAAGATASTTALEPTPAELLSAGSDVAKNIADWKKVGPLGVAVALLALLTQLMRTPFFKTFLDNIKLPWVRPVITSAVATAGGIVVALQGGVAPLPAMFGGLLAGLGGVGATELFRLVMPAARNEVRVDKDDLTKSNDALHAAVAEKALADGAASQVASALAAAKELPERQRLAKLAAMVPG